MRTNKDQETENSNSSEESGDETSSQTKQDSSSSDESESLEETKLSEEDQEDQESELEQSSEQDEDEGEQQNGNLVVNPFDEMTDFFKWVSTQPPGTFQIGNNDVLYQPEQTGDTSKYAVINPPIGPLQNTTANLLQAFDVSWTGWVTNNNNNDIPNDNVSQPSVRPNKRKRDDEDIASNKDPKKDGDPDEENSDPPTPQ